MKKSFVLWVLALFLFTQPVFGIEEEPITLEESSNLLGDVFGLRTELQKRGIDIQGSYMTNSFIMSNSERKSNKGTYQGLLNLSVELNSEKMGLYKGGRIYMLYQAANAGINSMNYLNSYSDINSYNPSRSINQISELWYEQSFGDDDILNLKIGKQDANIDFQALSTGFNFLNLSYNFIPNTPLPLYPNQQTGVRARVKIGDNFYIQNGFYDGNLATGSNPKSFFTGDNNYFNILEAYKLTNFMGKEGKYLAGSWIKTGKYQNLETSDNIKNNYGGYIGFEQKVLERFNKKEAEKEDTGLYIFAQAGYAREKINPVPYYGGIGAVYKGPVETRKGDSIGLAFNWHQFDKTLKHLEGRTAEKVVEVFYKIKITNYLYIQPDIQYIIRPGGTDKNAFVAGIRTLITF